MNGKYYGMIINYNGLVGTIKCINDGKNYKFSHDNIAVSNIKKDDYVIFSPDRIVTSDINLNIARDVKTLESIKENNK